jgi:hypothetical protein
MTRPSLNSARPLHVFLQLGIAAISETSYDARLALQLPFLKISESMGNHDSKIVDADSVD